jgi:Domain of unknown function (DUF1918)
VRNQDRWFTGVFDESCQEAPVPEVGDEVQLIATKLDQAARTGVVTEVRGRMLTVQWTTGNQSVFVPAPGTLTVLDRGAKKGVAKAAARKAPVRKTTKRQTTAKKAPVRKTTKRRTTVTKKAARKRVR